MLSRVGRLLSFPGWRLAQGPGVTCCGRRHRLQSPGETGTGIPRSKDLGGDVIQLSVSTRDLEPSDCRLVCQASWSMLVAAPAGVTRMTPLRLGQEARVCVP